MSNFDLIDDYLTNRLRGQDKELFENQLESDPALKSEVELQKNILEGIKHARALELKSMLSKVQVGASTVHFDFSIARLAAGLIGAGVLAASLYYYFKPDLHFQDASTDILKKTEKLKPTLEEQKPEESIPADSAALAPSPKIENSAPTKKSSKSAANEAPPAAVQKPSLEVIDPSEELTAKETSNEKPGASSRSIITAAHIDVEVDSSSKKYDFHYQFVNGKLMLYGAFDKSLYEVIEINGDQHSLFLYYRDQFYLVDEKVSAITRLTVIKDTHLTAKLKEYRQ